MYEREYLEGRDRIYDDLPMDSRAACKYLKQEQVHLQDAVSAVYAQTNHERHISVVTIDDDEGTARYSTKHQFDAEEVCQYIPVSTTKHVWGDVSLGEINWHEGTGYLTFGKRPIGVIRRKIKYDRRPKELIYKDLPATNTFHSQPSNDFYSDIPSVEDIFVFLRYRHQTHIVAGRTSCTVFKKTAATQLTIVALYDWEQENKYKRVRLRTRHPPMAGHEQENELEIEHRYMTIALRHIGLSWPTKLSARRKVWLAAIEKLGIAISQIRRH